MNIIKKIKNFIHLSIVNKQLTSALTEYNDLFNIIEDKKLNISYYDFSHVSIVKNGMKIVPQGWYLMKKGKHYSFSNPPKKTYNTFIECVLGNIKDE